MREKQCGMRSQLVALVNLRLPHHPQLLPSSSLTAKCRSASFDRSIAQPTGARAQNTCMRINRVQGLRFWGIEFNVGFRA